MTTNPNIKLAAVFLDRFAYWRDYADATADPIIADAVLWYCERYERAYRYLLRRANR